MKIPRYIKKDNKKYEFVKIYPNFVMYKNKYGVKEDFTFHELGLIQEKIRPPKTDLNVEKVKL